MLELAEDECQVFIENMTERAFAGKTPVEKPVYTALIGAPGAGKSHLAKKIKNSVVISSYNVIAEYIKTVGIDPRDYTGDEEVSRFATIVNNHIAKKAIREKYNITYDTSALLNSLNMGTYMKKHGYETEFKIMLVDEYQAAMNVVERKLDFDDRYTNYTYARIDGAKYPQGNPLEVMPLVSENVSVAVCEFIPKAIEDGLNIEIYEFGKDKPSFKIGDDFYKFMENIQLIPMEQHLERCRKLKNRADIMGKEDYFLQLKMLEKNMQKG